MTTVTVMCLFTDTGMYPDNYPPGQFPTVQTCIGPNEWVYWLVVVLVGVVLVARSPRDHGPGGQQLGFIFIRWGIVPRGELS